MINPVAQVSRRRFLKILGATSLSSALGYDFANADLGAADSLSANSFSWSGRSLGAEAEITLLVENAGKARELTRLSLTEIERLERIFSLHLPGSAIRQLNSTGELVDPAPELVRVLREARKVSELSSGVFDVSIQPVWQYLYYLQGEIDPGILSELRSSVDFRSIYISDSLIRFEKKNMQITLNGIAQGFITDAVTELLKKNGVSNVLVELGETYALGRNAKNAPWRIGISGANGRDYSTKLNLENMAVATSGSYGTPLLFNDSAHHLINAKTAECESRFNTVSVIAKSATVADALSTTLAMLPEHQHRAILAQYPQSYSVLA